MVVWDVCAHSFIVSKTLITKGYTNLSFVTSELERQKLQKKRIVHMYVFVAI